jgi:hypothetical protein
MPTFENGEGGFSVRTKINDAIERIESTGKQYATVADFTADVADGYTAPDGAVISAGPVQFQADSGAAIDGLPVGWKQFRPYTEFGLGAASSPILTTSIDDFDILSGTYSVDGNTIPGTTPPETTIADTLIVTHSTGNQTTQYYSVPNDKPSYVRKSIGTNSWGPWRITSTADYDTFADFLSDPQGTANAPDGMVIHVNGSPFIADSAAGTFAHPNIPGWRVLGPPTPQHFGSFGKLKSINPATPFLLSDVYSTLVEAQAVYPKATALTETIDDMAMQAMVDYLRDNSFSALSTEENNRDTGNTVGVHASYRIPFGVYYLTRPLDFTGIEFGHNFWELNAQGAIILGATPGEPVIDFTASRKMLFTGHMTTVGVWTAGGVPRCAYQFGRAADGSPADSHALEGGLEAKGRFSLGAFYNYASEDFRLGALSLKNDLDHRVHHAQFDGSDEVLIFQNKEPLTWGSSTGFVKFNDNTAKAAGGVIIRVLTGAPPVDNDVITGGISGKVATINGAPVQEPMGEGPGGKSYCIVQDGENFWGLTSRYQDDPLPDTEASFLKNIGHIDARHTGRGDAMWICRGVNHNYLDSYLVTDDADDGAGVVAFTNINDLVLHKCKFNIHLETDLGDLDSATGIQFGFLFDSSTPSRTAIVKQFEFGDNAIHPANALFFSSGKMTNVDFEDCKVSIGGLGRDTGMKLAGGAAQYTYRGGTLSSLENGTGPFMNLTDFADVGGCIVTVPNIDAANVRHPTGQYFLMGTDGRMAINSGFDGPINSVNETSAGLNRKLQVVDSADKTNVQGWLGYTPDTQAWLLSTDGLTADHVFQPTAYYPNVDNSYTLGIQARRWSISYVVDARVYDTLQYPPSVGIGGQVTQLTSKSTPVTINKRTGRITVHNESLAAGATVVFEVNNSTVTASDMIHVSVTSTLTDYSATVRSKSAGRFAIALTNHSGGALAQSFLIDFACGIRAAVN